MASGLHWWRRVCPLGGFSGGSAALTAHSTPQPHTRKP
ncbi:hypothetical protein I545_1952 [Mycobacterium kansasii 662]|uniref:Uncharacterized protein n=1 Tax=Mycobacterium kansasii 662 TaxID=1299326 RepID=X7ZKN5_MYCKA|nr:hypothetical protein I547_3771 [Mycobacterium kansasii 824]EUA19616.1 hypothetical protein I545_1952 [Mycobacterium kansasii 662]